MVSQVSIRLRILKANKDKVVDAFREVSQVSIRLRILKGFSISLRLNPCACFTGVDPFEDTERGQCVS